MGDVESDAPDVPSDAYDRPRISHDFSLQIIMELQKSVGSLESKIDRLIEDTKGNAGKIERLESQFSRMWYTGVGGVAVLLAAFAFMGWLFDGQLDHLRDQFMNLPTQSGNP